MYVPWDLGGCKLSVGSPCSPNGTCWRVQKIRKIFFAVKPGGAAAAVGKGWLSFPYSCVSA